MISSFLAEPPYVREGQCQQHFVDVAGVPCKYQIIIYIIKQGRKACAWAVWDHLTPLLSVPELEAKHHDVNGVHKRLKSLKGSQVSSKCQCVDVGNGPRTWMSSSSRPKLSATSSNTWKLNMKLHEIRIHGKKTKSRITLVAWLS